MSTARPASAMALLAFMNSIVTDRAHEDKRGAAPVE
jgi:hypothetical protein